MKPFKLKDALRGEPVVNRAGHKIAFIAHDPDASAAFRVLARAAGADCVMTFQEDGRCGLLAEAYDLFMAPKKRMVWVNLYPDSFKREAGDPNWGDALWHDTQEQADTHAAPYRIGGKAWPIVIEE